MIGIEDIKPAKAMWDSAQFDKDSVLMLRTMLNHHQINDSRLEEGGTQDNVDGYIVLLDAEDRPEGKVYVQVKHLTYPPEDGNAYYDIPSSLVGYAGRFRTDVILFIACDTDNKAFFWKCIDDSFIDECLKKGLQRTYRYHFKENESATSETVDDTLSQWRNLYRLKMDSIKEENESLDEFMSLQKKAFNQTPSVFFGVEGSFIKRQEVDVLYNWVINPLPSSESSVKLLIGDAGVGKTVVIKSVIERLENDGIKTLSIKADRVNITEDSSGPLTLETLLSSINLMSSQQDKVVLIIDQIDALSQNLSNDRVKLNVLLDTVASLKKDCCKPSRIIVSCRKYDLIYDSSLKALGIDNAIEMGKMLDEDVKSVLDKLSLGLFERLNEQTRTLLRKAQLLDMFCRLYIGGHRHTKYENEIALFDELWLHLTNDCPSGLTSSEVERFLFSIAKTIQDSETLSPYWTPSVEEYPYLKYLASEGVLRYDGGQVSFFHQSFLDYSSARQYIKSGRSFVLDIKSQFQGLEIRSKIKLVLDYLRSHSELHYKDVLLDLLQSTDVRPHIKMIAVSVVASAVNPYAFERKVVRNLFKTDHKLYAAFLNGASAEWFPTEYVYLLKTAGELTKEYDLYGSIAFFLSRNALAHSEEVVSFVNLIDDEKTRSELAYYLLRGDIDYREVKVKLLYRSIIASKVELAPDCVSKAMDTDYEFAIKETKRLLHDYLLDDEKKHRDHDDYVLFEVICKRLYEERPRQLFEIMVDCFIKVVIRTSIKSIYWFKTDSVFGNYWVRDYPNKMLGWLMDLCKTEVEFASSYVQKLLETNSEKAITLAFIIMACSPSRYDAEIRAIVSDDRRLDDYLEYSDFQYYFLELLKFWYLELEAIDKEWYQNRVLQFHSYTDVLTDRERKFGSLLYFSLWRRKWELIYTIADDGMMDELRRCKLELRRRFGCDYENSKHSSGVSTAVYCGGIVSSEVYKTFSQKAWLHSFYGIKEHRPGFKGKWIPFDERVHAREFSLCVSANPLGFQAFVENLFWDDRISDLYRFSGLDGLLNGRCEPKCLAHLFRYFMTNEFISHNSSEFFGMSIKFAQVDEMKEDLFQLYRRIILSDASDICEDEKYDSMERHVTEMLNRVINKPSGHALEALIDLASIKELRERVYKELGLLSEMITPEMRLLVIHKMYSLELYDERLFDSLLGEYLPRMGVELLYVRPDLIQRQLYFFTDKISSFVNRVHKDKRSHVVLAQVYFYGINHLSVKEYCRSRLEEILDIGEEKAVAKMIEVAYKHIQDVSFSLLSETILRRFCNDDRDEVRRSYIIHCNDFPIASFPLFVDISSNWKPATMHEWHSILAYVLRCCPEYAAECCLFVFQHKIIEQEEPWRYQDELVKVLLAIYKKLKYDDDREMLEKLMDLFDGLILQGNRTISSALETLS